MRHGRHRFIAGFLAAPLAIYAIFVISPFVQAVFYSFTDWTGVAPQFRFVGLDNFRRLLQDTVFRSALGHNVLLLIALPVITVALALSFAYLLNVGGSHSGRGVQAIRGSNWYKVVLFLPQVLSVPVVAVIWSVIMDSTETGLANSLLSTVGIGPSGFLAEPSLALWCVLWVLVWCSVGFYLVLFNAAMSSVPRDIFEAALIDGASRRTTFARITLPLLWDTIQTSWVYLAILALDTYALIAVMTVGPGGPDNSTQVMALQIVDNGFQYGRAAYASAMGVALFVLTMIVAAVMLRVSRRERVEY